VKLPDCPYRERRVVIIDEYDSIAPWKVLPLRRNRPALCLNSNLINMVQNPDGSVTLEIRTCRHLVECGLCTEIEEP
jgi:hypothetical protein